MVSSHQALKEQYVAQRHPLAIEIKHFFQEIESNILKSLIIIQSCENGSLDLTLYCLILTTRGCQ